MAVAVPLAMFIAGGCGTTIDPSANFGVLRRYAWGPGSPSYSPNSLVEANVQSLADPLLVTGNPDLIISVKLDNYPVGTGATSSGSWT